jgi:hypothetical protein
VDGRGRGKLGIERQLRLVFGIIVRVIVGVVVGLLERHGRLRLGFGHAVA